VDDEMSFLDILQMVLSRAGYQVLTTGNGNEAFNIVRNQHPDLVLLDDMLPGLSGGDICVLIKNDPHLHQTPVIVYSAGPRVREPGFGRQTGADAILLKPFKPGDLVKKIGEFMPARIQ
jgi:two-component system alkaline phosphatase synthesis response regulator PhoP